MTIKKIKAPRELRAEDVPQLMLAHQVKYEKVACLNWPEAFPVHPQMEVAMAHTGDNLLLHYRVEEDCIRAAAEQDGGRVWEDSCCEIFLQAPSPITQHPTPNTQHPTPSKNNLPSPKGGAEVGSPYFNLECNCAGTLLIAKGPDRHDRQPAPEDVLKSVGRWSSLTSEATPQPNGRYVLPLENGDFHWHMALVVPATALFGSGIDDFSGLTLRGNIYKCGDCLREPHFLSLFPIETPQPDFHRPEFFQELRFE